MRYELPWPPTGNKYFRKGRRGQIYTAPECLAYRELVWGIVNEKPHAVLTGHLEVKISAILPKNKTKWQDLDNLCKVPLDALEKAGVYENDKQIAYLHIRKDCIRGAGCLVVHVSEIQGFWLQSGVEDST